MCLIILIKSIKLKFIIKWMGLWQKYQFWKLLKYLILTPTSEKQIEMFTFRKSDTIKSEIGYGFVYLIYLSMHSV
jgi:hypothetical protein